MVLDPDSRTPVQIYAAPEACIRSEPRVEEAQLGLYVVDGRLCSGEWETRVPNPTGRTT